MKTTFIAAGEVLSFVACQACGLIFRSPRPTPEQIANFYQHLLPPLEPAILHGAGISEQLADARNDLRYALLFDDLRPLMNGTTGHVVDIGGWDGRSLVPWQAAGWSTTLIDPGAAKRTLANHEIRALASVEEATRAKLQPATLITSYHCVEHILDIDSWIEESRRLSDADTTWVIEVPFEVIYIQKLLRRRPLERANIHDQHLNFFTPRSMTALALRMGLEPESVKIVVTPYWHGPSVSLRMVARASSDQKNLARFESWSSRRVRASMALWLPVWRRVAGLMFRYTRVMHPEWG
ncbi:MAG: class I SAM-dependent methyltransferase [Myxococcales bacterium]